MKWALAEFFAELCQRDRLIQVLLNIAAHGFDNLLSRVPRHRFRTAAQAFAKSCALGLLRRAKERYILAPWPLRGTRWAAIYSCRRDREDELSIAGAVPRRYRLPARVFSYGCGYGCHSQLSNSLWFESQYRTVHD